MAIDPFGYTGMAERVEDVPRVNAIGEPHTQAAGPAEPARFIILHQSSSPEIAATRVHDVAGSEPMASEPGRDFIWNSGCL